MREAGDVCYSDVYKDGTGVVEFLRRKDMEYAVKHLDDSKFRSHEVKYSLYINNIVYIMFKIWYGGYIIEVPFFTILYGMLILMLECDRKMFW